MLQDQKMKKYLRAVRRRLNMPAAVKDRVMNDLISSIQGRREAGQTDAELFTELGSPAKAAAELNEQMREYTYVKSPWRWLCLAIAIVSLLSLLFGGAVGIFTYLLSTSLDGSLGIIGGADGPTAIFITASPDFTVYQGGFALLLLIMGGLGFWRLSRCPRKTEKE